MKQEGTPSRYMYPMQIKSNRKRIDNNSSMSPSKLSRPPTNDTTQSNGFNRNKQKLKQLPEIVKPTKKKESNPFQFIHNHQEFQDMLTNDKDERYLKMCFQKYENMKLLEGKPLDQLREDLFLELPRTEPLKKKQAPPSIQTMQVKGTRHQQMAAGFGISGFGQDQQRDSFNTTMPSRKESLQRDNSFKDYKQQREYPSSSQQQPQQQQKAQALPEEDLLDQIRKMWDKEVKRILAYEKANKLTKKMLLAHTEVAAAQAELEEDVFLKSFGTAYSVVLTTENFAEIIETLQFQYVLFDAIVESQMSNLKKMVRLKKLILKDNHIYGLLQVAKLEHLNNIRSLVIQNNPICNCSILNQFIVYRIPYLSSINNKDIRQEDKNKSKQLFQNFDKSLLIADKMSNPDNYRQLKSYSKDRNYLKLYQKAANEVANEQQLTQSNKKQINMAWDDYVNSLIGKCKQEMQF